MRRASGAIAFMLLLVPAHAHASPEDLFGYGARSAGMAGMGAAVSDDFEAAYTNPALLSRIRHPKLTLGLLGATFDEEATGPGLPGRIEDSNAQGLAIGADLPIPLGGILKDRVAGALAFYTPSDVVVRGRILYPEIPQFPLLSDRAQCVAIRMGIGLDLGHGFRLGGGFAALAEIVGTVVVATDASGKVGTQIDDQLVATYAPIIGLSHEGKVGKGTWRTGAVFRGALAARFSVSIDATKLSSIAIPVFDIAGLAQYDPLQAGLEAQWNDDKWTLTAGVTWKHWSDYAGPLEPTLPALDVPKPDFSDTVVPRAAVERNFALGHGASFHVRGGYFFEPTPVGSHLASSQKYDIPTQSLVSVPTRYFDGDRHVFTAGLGLTVKKPIPLNVDTFAQAHVIQPRTMTLDAGNADGSPSTANISGSIFVTGVQIGVGF